MSFSPRDQEDKWHDGYHDDPITEKPNRKVKRNVLNSLAVIAGSLLFFQTTLAANISLGTVPVEFGQGVTQTVACSSGTNLTIIPNSSFTNASGGGSFYFSSVAVSNIPVGCYGKDFIIRAYGNTDSTPLALFNTTSTAAVVYNNSGTFQAGLGMTGATVSSGSGTFTVTFTSPVALSTNVFKVTIESAVPSVTFYNLGDTGPGGGKIFYYSAAGFNCGPTLAATCNYLEAAPSLWNGGAGDPVAKWANNTSQVVGTYGGSTETATAIAIGSGYRNTLAIIRAGNSDIGVAAALADSHTVTVGGVTFTDWYLPSLNELIEMYGERSRIGGFATSSEFYWTSTEVVFDQARRVFFGNGSWGTPAGKGASIYLRPIRAF